MGSVWDDLTGRTGKKAIKKATGQQLDAINQGIGVRRQAGDDAAQFFSPFANVAQDAIGMSSFLTDPQAQFDFLQSNPIFQNSLNIMDRNTAASAAAGGRLSAGDTMLDFGNNMMQAAMPLIDRQSNNINNMLNFGRGIATQQAGNTLGTGVDISNLLQSLGNTQSAGTIAKGNAQMGITGNILQGAAQFFSDSRLKENPRIVGKENGFDIWEWEWNEKAKDKFSLSGTSKGVMFSDVLEKSPENTGYVDGFGVVNYEGIGIAPEYN